MKIGKPNGSKSRNYLRCAASNPKALLTAYSDYQKCLWGSARLNRLTEQPKCGYILSKSGIINFQKMIFLLLTHCSKISNSIIRF